MYNTCTQFCSSSGACAESWTSISLWKALHRGSGSSGIELHQSHLSLPQHLLPLLQNASSVSPSMLQLMSPPPGGQSDHQAIWNQCRTGADAAPDGSSGDYKPAVQHVGNTQLQWCPSNSPFRLGCKLLTNFDVMKNIAKSFYLMVWCCRHYKDCSDFGTSALNITYGQSAHSMLNE